MLLAVPLVALALTFNLASIAHSVVSCGQMFPPRDATSDRLQARLKDSYNIRTYDEVKLFTEELIDRGYTFRQVFFLLQNTPYMINSGNFFQPAAYARLVERVIAGRLSAGREPLLKKVSEHERFSARRDATAFVELAQLTVQLAYSGISREQAERTIQKTTLGKEQFVDCVHMIELVYVVKESLEGWERYQEKRLREFQNFAKSSNNKTAPIHEFFFTSREMKWWDENDPSKEDISALFAELLNGQSPGEPDLEFNWVVDRPETPTRLEEGEYELRREYFPLAQYAGRASGQEIALVDSSYGKDTPEQREAFFLKVYQRYRERIRDTIISVVKRADMKLPVLRQSFGEIKEAATGEVVATVRFFDGTPERVDDRLETYRNDNFPMLAEVQGGYHLPLERAFKARGIHFKHKPYLDQLRKINPYQRIYEIGKLSFHGSPATRERAAKLFEYWFLYYYVRRYPDAIFYAHVVTAPHRRLYRQRYGMEEVERIKVPGQPDEYIMQLPAWAIGARLKQKHGLEWPKFLDERFTVSQ